MLADDDILSLLDTPDLLAQAIHRLPPEYRRLAIDEVTRVAKTAHIERARKDFRYFCKATQEGYIDGEHLKILTGKLNDLADGKINRLVVCMPPRHSKSRHSSELFPAYFLGRFPREMVMTISHTTDLATGFGRFVRNHVSSPLFQQIFPETQVNQNQSAASDWATTLGGKYFAAGEGSSLAGRGAGLLVVDDLVNEQTALQGQTRPEVFEKLYQWYLLARQRLMPGGRILIVNTRWAVNDPTGLILERSKEDWHIVNLPAVWPVTDKHPEERILWPEFWKKEEIFAIRSEMSPLQWEATYQQNPTAGGGTIIQDEWFRAWTRPKPPEIEEVIVTLDPAFSENERADPSAFGVFGIFKQRPSDLDPTNLDDKMRRYIIALDMYETWVDFPDLKTEAVEVFRKWRPTTFLVEDKASGVPLYQELTKLGLPISLFKVARGRKGKSNDKIARVNAIAPIVKSGKCYFPDGYDWAETARKQISTFPQVPHDDMVDCFTMALFYYRNMSLVEADLDDELYPDNPDEDGADGERKFGGYFTSVLR